MNFTQNNYMKKQTSSISYQKCWKQKINILKADAKKENTCHKQKNNNKE